MIDLVFPAPLLSELSVALRERREETAAIVLALPVFFKHEERWRLLVQEAHVVPDNAYEIRSTVAVQPSSSFQLACESTARKRGWSVIYCHSHPQTTGQPIFSEKDDKTEVDLAAYLRERIPNIPHVSLLFGAEGLNCRLLGTDDTIRVLEVGKNLDVALDGFATNEFAPTYDRQILAFGEPGQRTLQSLRVAIVGVGGTGSVIVQQLAHLGVRRYLLIDRDTVDVSNLNRLVGARHHDVGESKVSVARRAIEAVCGDAIIDEFVSDVVDGGCSAKVAQSDIVFCCTDSHASRNLLNTICYQYFVPCIDMGVVLVPHANRVVDIAGRVNMLSPGLACLTCLAVLDPDQIRRELLDTEHRNADPYFSQHVGISQPAVISLTSTVASLAITMFLSVVTGIPAAARGQFYDGNLGRVRPVTMTPHPECVTCSSGNGIFGLGDTVPLPERRQ